MKNKKKEYLNSNSFFLELENKRYGQQQICNEFKKIKDTLKNMFR